MLKLSTFRILLTASAVVLLFVTAASAGTLLVSQETPYLGYGYGLSSWNTFSGDINSAFGGAGNVTVDGADLNNLAYMLTFGSLMVDARQPGSQALSATEIANIVAYEATGRRVLLIGENSGWTDWNATILSTVGGTYSGIDTSDTLSRVVTDGITAGSPTLSTIGDGTAVGGLSLYSENVVTQWGAGNVVSLLSVNVQQDGSGNDAFDNNLAIWLAAGGGGTQTTPEPGTLVMFGSGILGLFGILRRKLML
jgi:hypothetical protein